MTISFGPFKAIALLTTAIAAITLCIFTLSSTSARAEHPAAGTIAAEKGLGINLEPVRDWSRSQVFADIMKQSRTWGSADAPWRPLPASALDKDGWPRQDAGVYLWSIGRPTAEEPGAPYVPPGIYTLSFIGRADVQTFDTRRTHVHNYSYEPAYNRSTADIVIEDKATVLGLSFTGTQGGIRKVELFRPGYRERQGNPGSTFTDEFLKAITPFTVLRLMDFLSTNNNLVSNWSERTRPDSATQARQEGVALEYAIELSNVAGKDLWLNVPYRANDDYIKQTAQLLKASLSPNRVLYIEYSNELWNDSFTQGRDIRADSVKRVLQGDLKLTNGTTCTTLDFENRRNGCYDYLIGLRQVAERTMQIRAIFAAVFGEHAMQARIRMILPGHFPNPHGLHLELLHITRYYGAPKDFLWGVATAPYFTAGPASADPKLTLDILFASMHTRLSTLIGYFSVGAMDSRNVYTQGIPYIPGKNWGWSPKAVADHYGLHHVAYEGGADTGNNTNQLALKHAANLDMRIGDLIRQGLEAWYGCGNDLFMYYSLASTWGRYGNWGTTNDIKIATSTPKMQALKQIAATPIAALNCPNQ